MVHFVKKTKIFGTRIDADLHRLKQCFVSFADLKNKA